MHGKGLAVRSQASQGCCLAFSKGTFLVFTEMFCAAPGAVLEHRWAGMQGCLGLLSAGGGPVLTIPCTAAKRSSPWALPRFHGLTSVHHVLMETNPSCFSLRW